MTRPDGAVACGRCYEANRDARLALSTAESFVQAARILLTVLTQRPEFSYNRAAIFVRQGDQICGFAALGAADYDDVHDLEHSRHEDFARVLSDIAETAMRYSGLERRVREMTARMSSPDDPLVQSLRDGLPVYLKDGLQTLGGGNDSGAGIVFPLFARGHAYAVVYADRGFSTEEPSEAEMWRASALGNMIDDFGDSDDLWIPTVTEPVGVLAERMLTVTRLAMRLAHLARNPLAVVGGFSHHLLNRIGDSAPARRALDAIVQSTTRLEDLIDDIPAYALSPDTEPGEVDLRDVVEDGVRSLPRNCRWSFKVPEDRVGIVTYAAIVAACVYIVGRYLGTQGTVRVERSTSNGSYDISFCSEDFVRAEGIEMMSVNQLVRMIGGACRVEAENHERRFVMTIPQFVHCPITPTQKAERF